MAVEQMVCVLDHDELSGLGQLPIKLSDFLYRNQLVALPVNQKRRLSGAHDGRKIAMRHRRSDAEQQRRSGHGSR